MFFKINLFIALNPHEGLKRKARREAGACVGGTRTWNEKPDPCGHAQIFLFQVSGFKFALLVFLLTFIKFQVLTKKRKPCYLGIFAGLSSTKLNQTF
ncbi:MAG: hypothetical protein CVU07_12435 [Bacteroidetes bacterium HGW-Bacteroidetes-23]|nr:MAG: hypothetical protein CVU07_12435 [Bacteroidetes bacterium HGW-Bacteroidetes-23]